MTINHNTIPATIVQYGLLGILGLALLFGALMIFWGARNGQPVGEGCYVITDSVGHRTYATQPPQYNVQTGALQFKTVNGSGWIFTPSRIDATDKCLADQPVAP